MAVDYIHKMKIIHSDINPMNILLTGSQGTVVKLGDFGSSRILTRYTIDNFIITYFKLKEYKVNMN